MKQIKFIKEYAKNKVGDIVNCSKKSAEAAINAGYAKYISEKPKEKEKEVDEVKEILNEEKRKQEFENATPGEINWVRDGYWDTWDKLKGHMKKILGEGNVPEEKIEWFFLAHSNDIIKGKPQLTEGVQKKIPLIRQSISKEIKGKGENKVEIKSQHFHMFDERYDKRYDGFLKDTFSKYFYIYQVVTKNEKKYFVLSGKKLPNEVCELHGMLVEMDDYTEMSKSLKIPSISGFFILKEAKPSVKIISKEEMIKFTKNKGITEEKWLKILSAHPLGTYNRFPEEMEKLKSAFVLSGKVDGWPMHLGILGPPGTNKTCGHIESLSSKFEEEPRIAEGSGWTIKGLGPSFKQSIADIGYLAKAHRMGWIDEIGKLIEKELFKHETSASNLLGDFNFLLEHKSRLVGSGNTGEITIQANSKFLMVSNPIANRKTIAAHIGIIDPTYMSRVFWWVQDEDEQRLVLSKNGIIRVPPKPSQAISKGISDSPPHPNKSIKSFAKEKIEEDILLYMLWGDLCTRDEFLTLFDSCYNFCSEIDDSEVNKLVDEVSALAKEPMKSSVWKPRAYHHVKLLIDGLVKTRCLFKDYDSSFSANQEDYDLAERILVRMVKAWETDLSPKDNNYGFGEDLNDTYTTRKF